MVRARHGGGGDDRTGRDYQVRLFSYQRHLTEAGRREELEAIGTVRVMYNMHEMPPAEVVAELGTKHGLPLVGMCRAYDDAMTPVYSGPRDAVIVHRGDPTMAAYAAQVERDAQTTGAT